MGEISPPTTADYAMSAASTNRDDIAKLRGAITELCAGVGLLTKHLVANGALTKEQGADVAKVLGLRG